VESGAGTTSANQELLANNAGSGGYNNPTGGTVGSHASTVSLTAANQYTVDYNLTLAAGPQITVSQSIYSGVGTGGSLLGTLSSTTTASTLLSGIYSFDGLGIGLRNSGTSYDPEMDITQLTVSEGNNAVVPEPGTLALLGSGMVLLQMARRRLQTRA
jgi:hypothetical protein